MTKSKDKLAIFIDGANLHSTIKSLAIEIDYKKLIDFYSSNYSLIRAYYYTALLDNNKNQKISPLLDWLEYNGYRLITKKAKNFSEDNNIKIKGNMDIELAVDALEISNYVDHVVLFSGDGDFKRLIEAIQNKGVKTTAVSSLLTNPPMIADELRRQVDNFIELSLFKEVLINNT